jgi:integrase
MPRTFKSLDPDDLHLRVRNGVFFFYRRANGVTERKSLHTRDIKVARRLAAERAALKPGSGSEPLDWRNAINKYIEDKTKGRRPPHLAGKPFRKLREQTAYKTRSVLTVFARECGVASPRKVKQADLQKYYEKYEKEGSARSTVNRISAFLDHIGCPVSRAVFDMDKRLEVGENWLPLKRAHELVKACKDEDLKFLLVCGFFHGMRLGEMVMSRCSWFQFDKDELRVPQREKQTQADGSVWEWLPKNGRSRPIPIEPRYKSFLKSYLKDKKGYCVVPERVKTKPETYRWDPTWQFEKYMLLHGERSPKNAEGDTRKNFTIHDMRRSYITDLCRRGMDVWQVSLISGDSVDVIEKHYWKKTLTKKPSRADASGTRAASETRKLRKQLKVIEKSTATKDDLDALLEQIKGVIPQIVLHEMKLAAAAGAPMSFAQAFNKVAPLQFWDELRAQLAKASDGAPDGAPRLTSK